MKRLLPLCLALFLSFNLFSQDFKSFFTIGNVGIDVIENGLNTDNGFVSLPGFHIRELDTGLGLSVESLKFNKAFSRESIYTTWFHSTLYWSPTEIKETIILGPYIDIDFDFHESFKIISNVGARFSLYHSVTSFFPEFKISDSIMLNSLNIAAGYSLVNKDLTLSISTDLSFLGLMFFKRQNEIAEARYYTK